MNAKLFVVGLLLLLMFVTSACVESAPGTINPSVDASKGSFQNRYDVAIPQDQNVYDLSGTVIGDVSSLTQIHGESSGSVYGSGGFTYGSYSSSLWQDGKGFVRITITKLDPTPSHLMGSVGDSVIIKTEDSKAKALLPGDNVTFKCRIDYENVLPISSDETFFMTKYSTYEWDYCRLVSPIIKPAE